MLMTLQRLDLKLKRLKRALQKLLLPASNARAGYYNRGGSGGNKKRMTLTIDGKTTYYDTKEDYERAVQREAKRLGIKTHQYVKTTENDVMGQKKRMSLLQNLSANLPVKLKRHRIRRKVQQPEIIVVIKRKVQHHK